MAKKRILICDDEKDILEVVQIILQQEYHIETVSRLEDPVALATSVNPDLILMDIWIPEIGGEEAVIQLKNNKATKDIPVIFFSANNETAEIARRAGADGFLSKPFEIPHLKATIAASLKP